jgi:hypothetical protein
VCPMCCRAAATLLGRLTSSLRTTQTEALLLLLRHSWGATRHFRLSAKKPRRSGGGAAAAGGGGGQRRRLKTGGGGGGAVAATEAGRVEKWGIDLGDGDLLVMGGTCQKTHKHELPRTARLCGRRINATFRCFRRAA